MFNYYTKRLYTAIAFVLLLPGTASAWGDEQGSAIKKTLTIMQELEANTGLLGQEAKDFLLGYQVTGSSERADLTAAIANALKEAKANNYTLTDQDYRFIVYKLLLMRYHKAEGNTSVGFAETEEERNELAGAREQVLKVIEGIAGAKNHAYKPAAQEVLAAYKDDARTEVVVEQLILRALRLAKKHNHTLTSRDYEILAYSLLLNMNNQQAMVLLYDTDYWLMGEHSQRHYSRLLANVFSYTKAEYTELLAIRQEVFKFLKAVGVQERYYNQAKDILNAYTYSGHNSAVLKVVMDEFILRVLRQAKKENRTLTEHDYRWVVWNCCGAIKTENVEVILISCYLPV